MPRNFYFMADKMFIIFSTFFSRQVHRSSPPTAREEAPSQHSSCLLGSLLKAPPDTHKKSGEGGGGGRKGKQKKGQIIKNDCPLLRQSFFYDLVLRLRRRKNAFLLGYSEKSRRKKRDSLFLLCCELLDLFQDCICVQ